MNTGERNYALDLLRGLTIALMIVVNNPGDWKAMFSILRHAEWDGFLGADIVFPLFLFVSGFAAALKIAKMQPAGPHCATALSLEEQEPKPFYQPLIRRAAILFSIGLFLNAWPFGLLPGSEFSFSTLRIWGVLQRIAVCALIGGLILYKIKSARGVIVALVVLAAGYEIGMRLLLIEAGGTTFGRSFALADNFARLVDTTVLPAGMLYNVQKIPFDPEGLFTSLTAVMTFLLGGLAFRLHGKCQLLALTLAVVGVSLAFIEPINKNLWTLPYVFLTGAAAVLVLTGLERIGQPAGRLTGSLLNPFATMGKNPLVIYVLGGVVGKALALWKLAPALSVKQYLFGFLTLMPLPPKMVSLFYSLLLLAALMFLANRLRRVSVSV